MNCLSYKITGNYCQFCLKRYLSIESSFVLWQINAALMSENKFQEKSENSPSLKDLLTTVLSFSSAVLGTCGLLDKVFAQTDALCHITVPAAFCCVFRVAWVVRDHMGRRCGHLLALSHSQTMQTDAGLVGFGRTPYLPQVFLLHLGPALRSSASSGLL